MSEHKNATVLRAIADGVPISDFEYVFGKQAYCLSTDPHAVFSSTFEIRLKQKTHVVNGFTVPEPLREAPERYTIYFVDEPASGEFFTKYEWNSEFDKRCLKRGIAHATKEGAIANCKARLGIDPYKDES